MINEQKLIHLGAILYQNAKMHAAFCGREFNFAEDMRAAMEMLAAPTLSCNGMRYDSFLERLEKSP